MKKVGSDGLNRQQRLFADLCCAGISQTEAYERAGFKSKGRAATACASRLAAEPAVIAYIQNRTKTLLEESGVTIQSVLKRFVDTMDADPNELIELRRGCCRFCYGVDHRYQYTPAELERAIVTWMAVDKEKNTDPKAFDAAGGLGYDPRKAPHKDCPECWGDGTERVIAKDTRKLSPAARRLYAGVKVTQHGLEIKTRDQDAAQLNVAKHLGMFKEKVEVTGKDGRPIESVIVAEIASIIDSAATASFGVGKGVGDVD